MRLLHNNIFNLFSYHTNINDSENMFNYHTFLTSSFDNYSFIEIKGQGFIDEFAIFNTNCSRIRLEITNTENLTFTYNIIIKDKKNISNISLIEFTKVKITFISEDDIIEVGYLILGKAVDFPPHDKQKTYTVNYTYNQYFSPSQHYFYRKLPQRSYDIWKVSFPYLTNDDREKIIDFFRETDFEPFVLQVWIEENISTDDITETYARYNDSRYNISKYNSFNDNVVETKEIIENTISVKPKYYMKAGLYVCINEKIDFKKGKNDLYQYSTELTFREIK